MIRAAEIEKMSLEERLETMELLWASLVRTPEKISSPDWHGEVLNERLAKIKRGSAEFLTLPQLRQRLKKKA